MIKLINFFIIIILVLISLTIFTLIQLYIPIQVPLVSYYKAIRNLKLLIKNLTVLSSNFIAYSYFWIFVKNSFIVLVVYHYIYFIVL